MAPQLRNRVSSGLESLSPVARFWKTTHAPDYIGFVVLLVTWILIGLFATPFHRLFMASDPAIAFPYAVSERVSVTLNFVYALYGPLGILVVYNLITRASVSKHEATYLPFAISVTLTSVITDIIKNAVGRPRPDLLARCLPAAGTEPYAWSDIDVCTSTNESVLQDGWRSFPSGHSSFSFAGLGFLSLFLAGQLHIFRYAAGGRDLLRSLLCLVPLIGAAMIAISRCQDYRHDVYDVCVGSALGMAVAYWSYRRHWPRLSSAGCDEPYPAPAQGLRAPWRQVADEETGPSDTLEMDRLSDEET